MRWQLGTRTASLTRLTTCTALLATPVLAVIMTAVAGRVADAADLNGPAVIVALDHSGRIVTLLPAGGDQPDACQSAVVAIYCGASRIDRLSGAVTDLPAFVEISDDQSALITKDRRWLDIDSGQSTPLPAEVALTRSAPVVISSDGRVYAGSNSDQTAGWVIDGASGLALPLPIPGAPVAVSATGRFVLIRPQSNCPDATKSCDRYLWDRVVGSLERVADGGKDEVASNVAADGSVVVAGGALTDRTFRLQRIGAPPAPIVGPAVTGRQWDFVELLSEDSSTVILRHQSGPRTDDYVVVDLASGTALTSFSSFLSGVKWGLSGDGSTLALSYPFSPKVTFEALRPPAARVHAYEEFAVAVTGVAGVPADASAVMANVTVTDPTADGFVTVWPCGVPRPLASNGNFTVGQTVATATLVRVGVGGRVCASSNVDVNLVVDIEGWFGPASTYRSMTPTRLLDSREGPGASTGTITAGSGLALPVAGVATVGADAAAVVMNVTAVDPTTDGFVTVWPCDQPRPLASSLNVAARRTIANLVVSAIGPSGRICFASNVDTQIVVDAQGWFGGDSTYRPITPMRLADTRAGETDAVGNLATGAPLVIPIRGVAIDATAVMLNVAVTNTTNVGWLVAWPCNETRPLASNINFVPGQTVANAVLAKVDSDGNVCVASNTSVDVVVDVTGTFGLASSYNPMTPTRALDTRS